MVCGLIPDRELGESARAGGVHEEEKEEEEGCGRFVIRVEKLEDGVFGSDCDTRASRVLVYF